MRFLKDHLTFLKYLIAGGTAFLIHLLLLFTFTDIFKIHYLVSTTIALLIVFWISFFLQKYWTFADTSSDHFASQAVRYFLMHSISFVANAVLMYAFVSIFGIWYMLSQIFVSLGMAFVTFVINKRYIFKHAAVGMIRNAPSGE